jgi:tripartite-type tricarboxylate transporter receptor subunit TctC
MKTNFALRISTVVLSGAVSFCLLMVTLHESSAAPYYEGKTITIVRGGTPGGTGERQARTVVPFLKKYISGNPSIVVLHMPGAAGRKAANYVNDARRRDVTLAAIGGGLAVGPILGLPGVKYDINKLNYLGSTESGTPYLFYTRKEAGFDSLDKLRSASVVKVGGQTVGHPIYYSARMIAYILGLKNQKYVTGYSGREMDLAVLRGEIDGRTNNATTLLRRNPEWVERGMINLHVTITVPKGKFHPRFKDVPAVDTFAKTDMDRKLLEMFRALLYPRWPFFLAPGAPKESITILREAFRKTFQDPEFFKYFEKMMGAEASPLNAEEVEQAIAAIPRDPEVLTLFKALAGPGPIPSR